MPGVIATELLLGLQILFVGDSITAGVGAESGQGYVERIAQERPGWDVVNAGCSGSTTRDWTLPKLPDAPESCAFRGAFEELAASHVDADVVHILLGTNDATGFFEQGAVPADEYASNLFDLASRFDGDVIVSVTVPFPDAAAAAQTRLDAYATALHALAASPDAPLRLGADFSVLDRGLLDGVHPTDPGHAWMAQRLMPLLAPEPASGTLLAFGLLLSSLCRGRGRA